MPSDRVSQEQQNGVNLSSVAPSSEVMDAHKETLHLYTDDNAMREKERERERGRG